MNWITICNCNELDAFYKFIANLAIPCGFIWRPLLPKCSTVIFLLFIIGILISSSRPFSFDIVKFALPSSTRVVGWDKTALQFSSQSNNAVFSWRSLPSMFFEVVSSALLVPTCKITCVALWRCGAVVITTAQLHSTKPELDGEDLWQWSRLEIRLNTFRRSTIPQKQFIIIIFIIT